MDGLMADDLQQACNDHWARVRRGIRLEQQFGLGDLPTAKRVAATAIAKGFSARNALHARRLIGNPGSMNIVRAAMFYGRQARSE